ncbi:hypothetical protein EDB87DRAFT_1598260 [Lactarius vividus]|nr:hypothetical protein EDB87DRAFT_1598260 [Lactarius vividus]
MGRCSWEDQVGDGYCEPSYRNDTRSTFCDPQDPLEQFQRDDNVGTLLAAMYDAFDFANQKDRFKAIGPDSKQAQILTLMLQHACNCCDFIQSYAKDSQFCTQSFTHFGGQVNMRFSGK